MRSITTPRDDWRRILLCSPTLVYVTDNLRLAETYAARWADRTDRMAGWVYEVSPGADFDIAPGEPNSWTIESADVISVVGVVPATRFSELAAWHDEWRNSVPFPLPNEAEWLEFCDHAAERAIRAGMDEATVERLLNDAPFMTLREASDPVRP